jgi:hypothetical protein
MWSLNSNDAHTNGLLERWASPYLTKLAWLSRLPSSRTLLHSGHGASEGRAAAQGNASAECAAPYRECTASRCCMQSYGAKQIWCYERDSQYFECRDWCDKPWSCRRVGAAVAFPSPPPPPKPPSPPPPPPSRPPDTLAVVTAWLAG